MNSTRGASQKKKKKNENANIAMKHISKRVIKLSSSINTHFDIDMICIFINM